MAKQIYDENNPRGNTPDPIKDTNKLLNKIRNIGEGVIDFTSQGDLAAKNQNRKAPYSKTPQEFNNMVDDAIQQRKNFELDLDLQLKQKEIIKNLENYKRSSNFTLNPEVTGREEQEIAMMKQNYDLINEERVKLSNSYIPPEQTIPERIMQNWEDWKVAAPMKYEVLGRWLFDDSALNKDGSRANFIDMFDERRDNLSKLDKDAWDRNTDFMTSVPRAFNSIFGKLLKSGITLSYIANNKFMDLFDAQEDIFGYNKDREVEDSPIYRLGAWLDQGRVDPNSTIGALGTDLGEAMGSMLGFIVSGSLLKPLEGALPLIKGAQVLNTTGNIAITGGMSQWIDEYEKGLKEGATASQLAWIGSMNFIGGMLEALPIESFLERISVGVLEKGAWKQLFKDMAIQSTEEGSQEALQQFISNLTAQQTYDVMRKLGDGVLENGAIGFISGAMMVGMARSKPMIEKRMADSKFNSEVESFINEKMRVAVKQGSEKGQKLLFKLRLEDSFANDRENTISKINEISKTLSGEQRVSALRDVINNSEYAWLYDDSLPLKHRVEKKDVTDATDEEVISYANKIITGYNDYAKYLNNNNEQYIAAKQKEFEQSGLSESEKELDNLGIKTETSEETLDLIDEWENEYNYKVVKTPLGITMEEYDQMVKDIDEEDARLYGIEHDEEVQGYLLTSSYNREIPEEPIMFTEEGWQETGSYDPVKEQVEGGIARLPIPKRDYKPRKEVVPGSFNVHVPFKMVEDYNKFLKNHIIDYVERSKTSHYYKYYTDLTPKKNLYNLKKSYRNLMKHMKKKLHMFHDRAKNSERLGQTKDLETYKILYNQVSKDYSKLQYNYLLLSNPKSFKHIEKYTNASVNRKANYVKKLAESIKDEVRLEVEKLDERAKALLTQNFDSTEHFVNEFISLVSSSYEDFYHGTSEIFEAFDDAYINTGEGAQVYGYGHYITSSRTIASSFYAANLRRTRGRGVVYKVKVFQNKEHPLVLNRDKNVPTPVLLQIYDYIRTLGIRNESLPDSAQGSLIATRDYLTSVVGRHIETENSENPETVLLRNFEVHLRNFLESDGISLLAQTDLTPGRTFKENIFSAMLRKTQQEFNFLNWTSGSLGDGVTWSSIESSLGQKNTSKILQELGYSGFFYEAASHGRHYNLVVFKDSDITIVPEATHVFDTNGSLIEVKDPNNSLVKKRETQIAFVDDVLKDIEENSAMSELINLSKNLQGVLFDEHIRFEDMPIETDENGNTFKPYGVYEPLLNRITVDNTVSVHSQYVTALHEVIHRLTIGQIRKNGEFKNSLQSLLDFAVERGYKELESKAYDLKNNPNLRLEEFIAVGLTEKSSIDQLKNISYDENVSFWDKIIDAIWKFIAPKIGMEYTNTVYHKLEQMFYNNMSTEIVNSETMSFSAESEPSTTSTPNSNEAQRKQESDNILRAEEELLTTTPEVITSSPTSNELITDVSSGVDWKTEALMESDKSKRVWRGMSSSGITSSFTDQEGKIIYGNASEMHNDITAIYRQAESETGVANNHEAALKIFKAKYESRAQVKEFPKDNHFDYLENVFYSMMNKTRHKVVTIDLDVRKAPKITSHQHVFPSGKSSQSSVIYDKRMYEDILVGVNKALGVDLDFSEIKGYSSSVKNLIESYTKLADKELYIQKNKVKEQAKSKTIDKYSAKILIDDLENKYFKEKAAFQRRALSEITEKFYKEGYSIISNKSEYFLVKIDSMVPTEELRNKLIQYLATEKRGTNAEKTNVWMNMRYWNAVFNPENDPDFDITQKDILKRAGNLSGEAPHSLITPKIESMLSKNENKYMYFKDGKINVRTIEIDANDLPSDVVKSLKEMLGDEYKNGLVGDGAIFSLPKVHDMFNLINGVDYNDWGRLNKYKTFEFGEQLLKAADQKVFLFSPLYKYMMEHNIGKVIMSTARKISYGQSRIKWEDVISMKKPPDSQTYIYDMRTDAYQMSAGKVKTEAKGFMPSYVTTMLTSYMSDDARSNLQSHLKSHINTLKTQTLDHLNSLKFLGKGIIDLIQDEGGDGYESDIEKWFVQNKEFINRLVPYAGSIEYYKQNVLSAKIQDAMQHAERNASYPVLTADMGQLSGYREYFKTEFKKKYNKATDEQLEIEANKYFDSAGFLKPGFAIIDKKTSDFLDNPKKIIAACNPPASLADIRPLEVILVLPTDTFDSGTKVYKTGAASVVVNIKQFQALSGKDFDIDKIAILNPKTDNLKSLYNFLKETKVDEELQKAKKAFETWDSTSEEFIEPENDIAKIQKKVNIPAVKVDAPLAHIIKLFGVNKEMQNLDITNPEQYALLRDKMLDQFIGRLYNVRLLYTAMLEKGGEITYINEDNQEVTIKTDMSKKTYNVGMLYWLTNYTLDWVSDHKLLSFDYDPNRVADILYTVEIDGHLVDNTEEVGLEVQRAYNSFLKPARLLLRRPENENFNVKGYAELKAQMLDAYQSMFVVNTYTAQNPYVKTGNTEKVKQLAKVKRKENPFDGTTIIESAADFFELYMKSPVGVLAITQGDIANMYQKFKKNLIPDTSDDKGLWGYEKNILNNANHPVVLASKILNRYRNISGFNPEFVDATKQFGKFKINNEGALKELLEYGKELRKQNVMPSVKNLFADLITGMFQQERYIGRQGKYDRPVEVSLGGKAYSRRYKIGIENGRAWFSYIDYVNEKTFFESEQFDSIDMLIQNEGSFPLKEALMKMDDTNISRMAQMFVFKGNSNLGDMVFEKTSELYSKISEDLKSYHYNTQRLFFKLGLGIYDLNEAEQTKYGIKFTLTNFIDSQSITHSEEFAPGAKRPSGFPYKEGENVKYHDLSPYLRYLSSGAVNNTIAKELYDEIMKVGTYNALNIFRQRDLRIKHEETLPIKYFSAPLSEEITQPQDTGRSKADIEKSINEIVDKLLADLPLGVKMQPVIDFWNTNNKNDKITRGQLGPKHKRFYINNVVRSYFNADMVWKSDRKTMISFEEIYNMLDKMEIDTGYASPTMFGARFLPAQTMIRRFSTRNISMPANSNVIFANNGKAYYLTPFSIMNSFGYSSTVLGEAGYMLSGSMIAQEIMRELNDQMNDNKVAYTNNSQRIRALSTMKNIHITENPNVSGEWMGASYKKATAEITEGTHEINYLKNFRINSVDGSIIYKGQPYQGLFIKDGKNLIIDPANNKTGKEELESLTKLARTIVEDSLPKGFGELSQLNQNKFKAIFIRQVMTAMADRYMLDYFAKEEIRSHISDLDHMSKHADTMSSEVKESAQALIRAFTKRAKKMESQISTMRVNKSGKKQFYYPHMVISETLYKEALIEYFIDVVGLKEDVAVKKANDEWKKLDVDANSIGSIKESLPTNFQSRIIELTKGYRKDENVVSDYFDALALMFRSRVLTVYEELNEEWLQHDNEFMQYEIKWQSAVLKTQSALYRPIESFTELSPRQFVRFRVHGKQKRDGSYWPDRIDYGEVVSVNENKSITIKLTYVDKETKSDVKEFGRFEIADMDVVHPIINSKAIRLKAYKLYGKDWNMESVDNIMSSLVQLRNKTLLTIKPYFGARNLIGTLFGQKAMYFSKSNKIATSVQKGSPKMGYVQYARHMESQLDDMLKDPKSPHKTEAEKIIIQMLLDNATAFFGGVNEVMGKVGFVASVASNEIDKDESNYFIEINQQWEPIRKEAQELLDYINGTKKDIGHDKKKVDSMFMFIRKIFATNSSMYSFYTKYALDTFPLSTFGSKIDKGILSQIRPGPSEEFNRNSTVLTALAAFTDVLDISAMTPQQKEAITPILADFVKTMAKQAISLVDYKYALGLDRSHHDMGGNMILLQFSHYINSLNNNIIDRFFEAGKQMKRFGVMRVVVNALPFKDGELTYEVAITHPVTGEAIIIPMKSFNELKRWGNAMWYGFLTNITSAILIGLGTLFVDNILFTMLKLLALNPLNEAWVNSFSGGVALLLGIISQYTLGDFLMPDDDDTDLNGIIDDDEEYFGVKVRNYKKALSRLTGMTFEQFKAWRLREEVKGSDGIRGFVEWVGGEEAYNEMLLRYYERMKARDAMGVIPIGVGIGDIMNLIVGAVISKGEFDNYMEMLQAYGSTVIPGAPIAIPLINAFKPTAIYKSDPYLTKRAEFEAWHSNEVKEQKKNRLLASYDNDNFINSVFKGVPEFEGIITNKEQFVAINKIFQDAELINTFRIAESKAENETDSLKAREPLFKKVREAVKEFENPVATQGRLSLNEKFDNFYSIDKFAENFGYLFKDSTTQGRIFDNLQSLSDSLLKSDEQGKELDFPRWDSPDFDAKDSDPNPNSNQKAKLDELVSAIKIQEGNAPGTRAHRNNNPGNLEWRPWQAAYGGELEPPNAEGKRRFTKFPDYESGRKAMDALILNVYRNATMEWLIKKYAPAFENNTEKYINNVVEQLGTTRKTKVSDFLNQ
jgi:hypothetical protein